MPSAGRMRPNTVSAGGCTTPRHRPVSTMTWSRTLVNRPKKPFQSPGTHRRAAPASVPGFIFISSSWQFVRAQVAARGPAPSAHPHASVVLRTILHLGGAQGNRSRARLCTTRARLASSGDPAFLRCGVGAPAAERGDLALTFAEERLAEHAEHDGAVLQHDLADREARWLVLQDRR